MRPLVHGALVSVVTLSACSGGTIATSATETDAATTGFATMTATVGTDGMSSTTAVSSSSTSTTSTTTSETDGTIGPTATSGRECPTPETYECDVWAQDDCCEGEKCNPWANDGGGTWVSTRCSPLDPEPDQVGEPCTVVDSDLSGIDSCVKGAMCWSVDPETNLGHCVSLCEGGYVKCANDFFSCCPDGFACAIPANGVLGLCFEFCDPIAQSCLTDGDACYPAEDWFVCRPQIPDSMGAVGDPCEFYNACDPGNFCGEPSTYPGCDLNAAGCCIPFCTIDMANCVPGTECLPWYEPMYVPPGYENLGACMIPP